MNYWHLFTLILLVAKLTGFFGGSWWVVFLPSAFGVVLGLFIVVCGLIIASLK